MNTLDVFVNTDIADSDENTIEIETMESVDSQPYPDAISPRTRRRNWTNMLEMESWLCTGPSDPSESSSSNEQAPQLKPLDSDSSDDSRFRPTQTARGSKNESVLVQSQQIQNKRVHENHEQASLPLPPPPPPPPIPTPTVTYGLQTEPSPVETEKRKSVRRFMSKIRRERKTKELERKLKKSYGISKISGKADHECLISPQTSDIPPSESCASGTRPPMSPGSQHSRGRKIKQRLQEVGSRSLSPFHKLLRTDSKKMIAQSGTEDSSKLDLNKSGNKKKFIARRFVANQRKSFKNRRLSQKSFTSTDADIEQFREKYMTAGNDESEWKQIQSQLITMSPSDIRKLLRPDKTDDNDEKSLGTSSEGPARPKTMSSRGESIESIELAEGKSDSPQISILKRSTYGEAAAGPESKGFVPEAVVNMPKSPQKSFNRGDAEMSKALISFSSDDNRLKNETSSNDISPEEFTGNTYTSNSLDVSISSSLTTSSESGSASSSSSEEEEEDSSPSERESPVQEVEVSRAKTGKPGRLSTRGSLEASLDNMSLNSTSTRDDDESDGILRVNERPRLRSQPALSEDGVWVQACACDAFNQPLQSPSRSTDRTRTTLDVLRAVFGTVGLGHQSMENGRRSRVETELPDAVSDITSYTYSAGEGEDE